MNGIQISLTSQECEYLVQILEAELKKHRVDEHRTRAPTYRERILAEEALITQLLTRLGQPPK